MEKEIYPGNREQLFTLYIPTRYDLYRFILSVYPGQFNPCKLQNEVYCTQMAPRICELGRLSNPEWEYLQTIVLNMGTENRPGMVLIT